MQPPETFETDRLLLRRARADDAQGLFDAYANDPQATRYLSWRTHESVAQTREFLDQAESDWTDGSEFIWVLVAREGSNPIGAIGVAAGAHGMEIGYVLGREWWGRGLMIEAVSPVMRWLQAQSSVHRIWAYCAVDHVRSARVLQRAGMSYEATLGRWVTLPNLSDEPVDAKVFAWTRSDTRGSAHAVAEAFDTHLASRGQPRG
jgi:ribosomal-protein-alanine N-acetyltransferase